MSNYEMSLGANGTPLMSGMPSIIMFKENENNLDTVLKSEMLPTAFAMGSHIPFLNEVRTTLY